MKLRRPSFLVLTVALAAVVSAPRAENLDAHVHGVSQLTVAIEAGLVEIQLTSPAVNLVGFEHKASTPKDIEAVKKTESLLRQHEALFSFSGTRCEHVGTSIDMAQLIDNDQHKHGAKKHVSGHEHEHKPRHEQDHDLAQHDNQQHGAQQHRHAQQRHSKHRHSQQDNPQLDNHSEVVALYQFRCEPQISQSSLMVSLFSAFPAISKVETMWVSQTKQGAVTLTPKQRSIAFR